MEKNEKGFPVTDMNNVGGTRQNGTSSNFVEELLDRNLPENRNGNMNGCSNGNDTSTNHSCGGGMLADSKLAYAYAPDQMFRLLYSAGDALKHGTLFEELYKPMEVYGNE